ncbi:MAG: hypothetical protein A2075_08745 [Geobacteraceae bacterium GWC2_58_44]|nr:MAG: hypothetical protein A2075_08745 [Geobacteraceae bacterium GWC2_58_44]HBG06082.1 hybrid sensor histidine kinase/response regulator [Geobacter sp.]
MYEPLRKEKREFEARRRTQERLRESEAMYRSLFDNMLNGFAHCRVIFEGGTPLDFVYLSVNDAFEELTGMRDVIGRRMTEVVPGIRERDPGLLDRYFQVALTGKPERFEIYVEALRQRFRISVYSPAKEYFITVFDVITERKLAEKAERGDEEPLKPALQGANDGLWDWNLRTGELSYSPRWKSMLGYADEALGNRFETFERLLHPEDREATLAHLRDFLEMRTPRYEAEFRMRHKEGHYLFIQSRGIIIRDDDGEALRVVGTHVDVTERKKLEGQIRQAQKMEAVGQLAGGVAHDFNNILSAILGYAQLIQESDPIEPTQSFVEEIIKSSKRATALTQDLLAFSRKQEVTLAVVDLSAVIREFKTFLGRVIREDIELKISCAGEVLPVMVDRGQIERVLMNLVVNSRDALPNGGEVLIETGPVVLDKEFIQAHGYGKAGAYALVSISDNGVGMDRETQSRIFEPFFTTKEQGSGTGLGLSMAYGTVKKHDGFITVYSEPGAGTIFKIYLPHVPAAAPVHSMIPKGPVALRGGEENILVGEDDEALRRLTTRALSHYGYRVIGAVDGQDAVDKFMEHGDGIDLVILDGIMPKKNGIEACREMRWIRPDLKAVFVSGYAKDIFAAGNALDGNSIFIQKPVAPHELLTKIRELLDAGRQIPAGGGACSQRSR